MTALPKGWIAGAIVVAFVAQDADAGTTGALYDIDLLLRQPHPFAAPATPPQPPAAAPAPAAAPVRPAPAPAPVPARRATQATPAQTAPAQPPSRVEPAATAQAAPQARRPIVSEVRVGALAHDQGLFSHHKEGGVDGNLEVLFTSPEFLNLIWSPRPHLGASVNSQGDTSQAYLGLTWEWTFLDKAFFDFSFGGAVHTGKLDAEEIGRKDLGCRALFRESIDLGYRFAQVHGVSLFVDHISNAKLCSKNEGLESVGVRYGYRF